MKRNSSQSFSGSFSWFGFVIGVALLGAPSVFAGDVVGEIVRDSVLLPLEAPLIIAHALVAPPPPVVVYEGRPEYYSWRRPAYYPAPRPYWGPGRPYGYGPRGPWGYRHR